MIESVVAVFVHGSDIFYIRRELSLKAFPGYHAFPGGKIDDGDPDVPYEAPFLRDFPARLMRALCRELREELGFDLEAAAGDGLVDDIVYLGLARPPLPAIGKFMAHHYKIVLKRKPGFTVDPSEVCRYGWIPVQELWGLYNQGKVLAVIPTLRVLEALAGDMGAGAIDKLNLVVDQDREVPVLELIRGVHFVFIQSRTFKISQRTNALIVGDPAFLVDPSPNTDDELRRVYTSIAPHKVKGILITHHHPDHHENIRTMALDLGVPVHCSAETHRLMRMRFGEGYLEGVEVRHVRQGDILTRWLGNPVRIYSLPGHDCGQVGIAPEGMEWFLVGDLIQASNWNIIGVVIPDVEGDMGDYFSSLQRIIDLDPSVIIPSHGMPLGGTWHIRETLASRMERERQILDLHRQGKGDDEILDILYGTMDDFMRRFTLMNIRSHLVKLSREGRI